MNVIFLTSIPPALAKTESLSSNYSRNPSGPGPELTGQEGYTYIFPRGEQHILWRSEQHSFLREEQHFFASREILDGI